MTPTLHTHLETRSIEALIPYARNSRTHSDEQVAQVAASIREFGFTNPVLIDEAGGIIAGHGRVLAARKLGLTEVPCLTLAGLSEAQKRAYVIADNKLALNAGWDEDLLALEIKDLQGMDFDLDLLGFDAGDLDELLALGDATPEGQTDPDDAPAVQAQAVTVSGDIWQLGKHRLMCGDSTDAAMVAVLMDGQKAQLMQTDPPYGVDYANDERPNPGVAKPRVANDDLLEGEKLQTFLEAMIRAALPSLDSHAAFYLWHPMLTQGTFFAAAAAAAADILIHRQIIWAKPVLLLGRGDYHWKHELCFYGWVRGNRPPFYGSRNQTTVWEIASVSQAERKEMNHATPKPVAIWLPPIDNHTKPGEIMYEPFSGSGSQIIAAEQTGRRCYAMELSPQYVDVAVRRWQAYTGQRAVHAITGDPFPG
jgi:DNA modification methylase